MTIESCEAKGASSEPRALRARSGWLASLVLPFVLGCGAEAPEDEAEDTEAALHASLPAGTTRRVSVASTGEQGNSNSASSTISVNGRFVGFHSSASNLVPGDTNGTTDAFVHDLLTGVTERVSVSSTGEEGNAATNDTPPELSGDGRFVAFESLASNLVAGDTNGVEDIFVHDRRTRRTTRVSVSSNGTQSNNRSIRPKISANGRFVAFGSLASNLVPGDTNGVVDAFVHDRLTRRTRRVSVSSSGEQGNAGSDSGQLDARGRLVTFVSNATNLIANDTNARPDVFAHDLRTGRTFLVSTSSSNEQGNSQSAEPSISADGRFVVFRSSATNLVPDGTNGFLQVFVRDLRTRTTTLASVSSTGEQADGACGGPTISADGRFVGFDSDATNFGGNSGPGNPRAYIHDRWTGETAHASVSSDGTPANDRAFSPRLSGNGRLVVFDSGASNLVPGDTNDSADVFVRALRPHTHRPRRGH